MEANNALKMDAIADVAAVCQNNTEKRGQVLQSYIVRVHSRLMARPLRLEFPGAVYHVTSLGTWGQPVY